MIFELPAIHSGADADKAMQAILTAVTLGELTPSEAEKLTQLVERRLKTIEARDLERRLRNIEEWRASEN